MNRMEAINTGSATYTGIWCLRHPELQGERVAAHWGCVGCTENAAKDAVLLRREPYTRKTDGGASELLHWEMKCLACGECYEATSGPEPHYRGRRYYCNTCTEQGAAEATKPSGKGLAPAATAAQRKAAEQLSKNPTPAQRAAQKAWGQRMQKAKQAKRAGQAKR